MKYDDICNTEFPPKRSGVLNQTIARQRCLASYGASPGPVYYLPSLVSNNQHDPRSTYNVAPAFSFGLKVPQSDDKCGPGPAYRLTSKILNTGWDRNPAYTMNGRHPEKVVYISPGPARYHPRPICCLPSGPTFGHKFDIKDSFYSPGPAAYQLQSTIGCNLPINKGSAPCFSIAERLNKESANTNPGPGSYKIVDHCLNKPCQPKYTMAARFPLPYDKGLRPGPGRYCPEKVRANMTEAPHYSFGIKWSPYVSNNIKRSLQTRVCKIKSIEKDVCAR